MENMRWPSTQWVRSHAKQSLRKGALIRKSFEYGVFRLDAAALETKSIFWHMRFDKNMVSAIKNTYQEGYARIEFL
jgi:hypothetical protein